MSVGGGIAETPMTTAKWRRSCIIRAQSEGRSWDMARATKRPPGRGEGRNGLVGDSEKGRAAYGESGAQAYDAVCGEAGVGDVGSAVGAGGVSKMEEEIQGASREGWRLKSMDSKKIGGTDAE